MVGVTSVINLYMAIVMIGFRIHYTVDIIIGIMIANYLFILLGKAAPDIDEFIKRLFNYVWQATANESMKEKSNISSNSDQDLEKQNNRVPLA